jgi:hypothetical protein
LQLKNILYPIIWVNIQLHLFMWKSLHVIMFSLKTTNPYFTPYTSCGRNDMCPMGLSYVLKTHLFDIIFWYGVFVILTYSLPFSWLHFVYPLGPWQFASKSNCRCKLRVTIRFILFHNSFFFKVCRSFYSPYGFNRLDFWCFLTYPFQIWIENYTIFII